MTWNHRVMRRKFDDGMFPQEDYGVYEVYYDKSGKIVAWGKEPTRASCDTLNDLRECMQWMMKALDKPVLDCDMEPEGDWGD